MTALSEPGCATLEERVTRLEDVRSIGETVAHYARCVDAADGEGVASVFTKEGSLCSPGNAPICGRERLARAYSKLLSPLASATHMVSNLQINFSSSESARGYCVLWAWEGMGESLGVAAATDRFSFGRYEFDFVKEIDGQWRVAVLNICFAGQTGTDRFAEHRGRPWPPEPLEDQAANKNGTTRGPIASA